MRPEYLDAVDAVRWGWSYWLALAVPAGLIWFSAYRQRAGCILFVAACLVGWCLSFYHIEHLWDTKGQLAQTEAEREDFTSDVSRVFAPVNLVPYVLRYCCLHAAVSQVVFYGYRRVTRKRRSAPQL